METTQNVADHFHLPDEIATVIPTDPYDQLDLARKITSMAIASRVSQLEVETGRLRQKAAEKDRMVAELQGRLGDLERMFQEAVGHLRASLEENVKLSDERDMLVMMTKKLSRELAKLETFKRNLMQSLSEDNHSHVETADMGTSDLSTSTSSFWKDDRSIDHTSNLIVGSIDNTYQEGNNGQRFSITSYISPRLNPTGTPKITSTGVSPRGFSAVASPKRSSAASPKISSVSTSPRRPGIGQASLAPRHLTIQQSSAAGSPTSGHTVPGQTSRIDGKEFFFQVRNRLSYEQFGAFLSNIKEFNSHRQSREDTLTKAGEIFGTDNEDLYLSFKGLLYPNLP
ncbi:hypothetical protein Taro_007914 [Colocasia esculenta]|uniref:At4g15545-like C-terminal domain-containing protein n=1 Tax=Colocasia esculenta TaxID=4460 RepID=A0A843TWA9_COLES|nr:hypothetical protein [Colocasia esculenta]